MRIELSRIYHGLVVGEKGSLGRVWAGPAATAWADSRVRVKIQVASCRALRSSDLKNAKSQVHSLTLQVWRVRMIGRCRKYDQPRIALALVLGRVEQRSRSV